MTPTSYTTVPVEEVRTACEIWLDTRNERIKNKIQKAIEEAMWKDYNPWWKKLFKISPKNLTQDQAFELIHNNGGFGEFSTVEWIEQSGKLYSTRVEKLLHACKAPNDGFIYLSVEDNSILEGYYQ